MGNDNWSENFEYLELLGEIKEAIDQLNEVEQRKIDAVHHDDLVQVDECIKQEQVISLTMRSLEQKRSKLLQQLGLGEVSLAGLSDAFPPELYQQTSEIAGKLRQSYDLYTSVSEAARMALERGLREIDNMMAATKSAQAIQPVDEAELSAQAVAHTYGPQGQNTAAEGERKKIDFGA